MRTTAKSPRLSLNKEGLFKTAGSNRQAEALHESARTRKSEIAKPAVRVGSPGSGAAAALPATVGAAAPRPGYAEARLDTPREVGPAAPELPAAKALQESWTRTAATRHCQFACELRVARRGRQPGGSAEAVPVDSSVEPPERGQSATAAPRRPSEVPMPGPESRGIVVVGWQHCRQRTRCRAGLRPASARASSRQLGRCRQFVERLAHGATWCQ